MSLMSAVIANGVLAGFMYALLAAGLSLIYGVMRRVNFCHGALTMLAMYCAYWANVKLGLDPLISVVPIGVVFFLIGAVLYRSTVKPVLDASFAIQCFISFGTATLIVNSVLVLWTADFRRVEAADVRLEVLGASIGSRQLLAALVCLAAFVLLSLLVHRTRAGMRLRAVSEDKNAAVLMGINVEWIYSLGWGIGIATVGVAGTMASMLYPIYPDIGSRFVLYSFVAVTLGGFGSLLGALLGGLLVGLIEAFGGVYVLPAMKSGIVCLVFIIMLLVRPHGLFGID